MYTTGYVNVHPAKLLKSTGTLFPQRASFCSQTIVQTLSTLTLSDDSHHVMYFATCSQLSTVLHVGQKRLHFQTALQQWSQHGLCICHNMGCTFRMPYQNSDWQRTTIRVCRLSRTTVFPWYTSSSHVRLPSPDQWPRGTLPSATQGNTDCPWHAITMGSPSATSTSRYPVCLEIGLRVLERKARLWYFATST